MFDPATDNVLKAMYSPNDKLGVELMGAVKWNGLKKAVAAISGDAVKRAVGVNPANINAAANRARMYAVRPSVTLQGNDPLVYELLGVNEGFCTELLGESLWQNIWGGISSGTHKILEWGEDIPIINASVERARETFATAKGIPTASEAAAVLYENRYKILVAALGVGAVVYFLTRKKGRR